MLNISVGELVMMIVVLPLLGGLIGYVVASNRARADDGAAAQVAALEEEVATYKKGVNAHFEETADLMQQMTAQYRALYAHMAQGAVSLCDAPEDLPRLEAFKRLGLALDEAARAEAESAAAVEADAADVPDDDADADATRDPGDRGEPVASAAAAEQPGTTETDAPAAPGPSQPEDVERSQDAVADTSDIDAAGADEQAQPAPGLEEEAPASRPRAS